MLDIFDTFIEMKIRSVINSVCIVLSLVVESVQAQGGFFQQLISSFSNTVSNIRDNVSGAFDGGGLGGLVSNAVDFVVLSVATVVIGQDPEELACQLIQDKLAAEPDVSCTCASDITVTTTTADLSGTCAVPNTCPVPGACGVCSADYNGSGNVVLTDQTIAGSALVNGSCKLDQVTADIGITAAIFDFTATLEFDGGFSSLELAISGCTADFKDPVSGNTVSVCVCSVDGCGPLEISYTCGGSFDGMSSGGCVSITGLGGN